MPDLLRESEQYSTAADELIEALAADLLAEDVALAEALKKGRLELWWPSLIELARDHAEGKKHGGKKVYDSKGVDAEGDVQME